MVLSACFALEKISLFYTDHAASIHPGERVPRDATTNGKILYSNRLNRGVSMKHFELSNTIQVRQFKDFKHRHKKKGRNFFRPSQKLNF